MSQVVIIGCGVIGSAIAYELSQISGLNITVLDQQPPAQGSTGAALGVLMGIISHKTKGRAWQLRQSSMQRYETLIPELEAITGCKIAFNRQGILLLCFAGDDLNTWENLVQIRQTQGYRLQQLNITEINTNYPQINCENIIGAVYSPQDRQINPTALTLALIDAAQRQGATFKFGVKVAGLESISASNDQQTCQRIQTSAGELTADWVVIASGLGTTPLIHTQSSIQIKPVLGQALQVRLNQRLGISPQQPVITGNDIHIVPLRDNEYWVGATVEFPQSDGEVIASSQQLDQVMQGAIAICPALAEATLLKTWSGLRPRPEGIPAPIIDYLPGYTNVLLATGHYRNGILLAPATALQIRQMILAANP